MLQYISQCVNIFFIGSKDKPLWRNWQTHTTQNRTGNHMGSSPISGIFYGCFKSGQCGLKCCKISRFVFLELLAAVIIIYRIYYFCHS